MLQLSNRVFLIALFILIFQLGVKAQQLTDKTTFLLNEYLYTNSSNPYPLVNEDKLSAINTSQFVNVMNYGAKGDGKSYDDAAIKKAFMAAKYGVIFPKGKTFLVSDITKVTLTHDLTVYAYGATIKMADMKRYSFLSLQYKSGSYHNKVIWLGGTFDGNQYNQIWPGNPHGGKYNGKFVEDHGRFVGVSFAEFALFKDVRLVNTTMDGISLEANKIAVIANCKASNGAWIDYDVTGDQASYFKCTRTGSKAFYCISDTCLDGAIGIHYSTPTSQQNMQDGTLMVLTNCYLNNQYSGTIHVEDCHKVFLYKCRIEGDTKAAYKQPAHFSNQTEVASIKNCTFKNIQVNFNEASHLKLALIDGCTFTTETSKLRTFINGHPHVSTNNSFSGTCGSQQADVKNVRNCTFTNFGSLAVSTAYATDGSTFINGTTPVSTSSGGFVVNCIFKQVKNTSYRSSPSNDSWKKVFSSYIDVYSDANKYLGRIGSSDATQSLTTTTTRATALSSSATRGNVAFNLDSVQHSSVSITGAGTALSSNQQIKLYPNPTTEVLHVNLNGKVWGKTLLNIYDQQGRLVQSKAIDKNTAVSVQTMNVSQLTSGSYILQIVNEHQKSALKFTIAK